LERDDAAVANVTRQPAHQRGGIRGKEQHAPTDDRIEAAVQLDRSRIADDERNIPKPRGRGPGSSRLNQLRVEIDPDDSSLLANEIGRQQCHVASPGPNVENLHPTRDARVLQEPRGVRREHFRLQPQALGLLGRLTEQVIRCLTAHSDGLMTSRRLYPLVSPRRGLDPLRGRRQCAPQHGASPRDHCTDEDHDSGHPGLPIHMWLRTRLGLAC
jgi:hypothetical protein